MVNIFRNMYNAHNSYIHGLIYTFNKYMLIYTCWSNEAALYKKYTDEYIVE